MLKSIFADQMASLCSRLRNAQVETSNHLQHILRPALLGCFPGLDWQDLRYQGLAYTEGDSYELVYPKDIMLKQLGSAMAELSELVGVFAKGPAFEIVSFPRHAVQFSDSRMGDKKGTY